MHDEDQTESSRCVRKYYPTCLALIGADIFQLIATRPTAVHYESLLPGHITSYRKTCDRRLFLLHHRIALEQAR